MAKSVHTENPSKFNRRSFMKGAIAVAGASTIKPVEAKPEEEFTLDGGVHFFKVLSDNMVPTLRRNDAIIYAASEGYEGEGVYLIRNVGEYSVYRAQKLRGLVFLLSDNKRYPDWELTLAEFNDCVVGKATALMVRP